MVRKPEGHTQSKRGFGLRVVKRFVRGRAHKPNRDPVQLWGSILDTAPFAPTSRSKPSNDSKPAPGTPASSSSRPDNLRPLRERNRVNNRLNQLDNVDSQLEDLRNRRFNSSSRLASSAGQAESRGKSSGERPEPRTGKGLEQRGHAGARLKGLGRPAKASGPRRRNSTARRKGERGGLGPGVIERVGQGIGKRLGFILGSLRGRLGYQRDRRGGNQTHSNRRSGGVRAASLSNVVSLPRIGYERLALRIREGSLRLKLGLLLLAAFVGLIGVPTLIALSVNRDHRLPVLALITTRDAQDTLLVYRWNEGKVVRVPLSEYLVNVLAAEISPRAPMSALQAAAIAARTYAIRSTQHQLFSTPTFAQSHGADVTDNGVLDLPWLTAAQQQARFGSQANADIVRYQQAVASTDGQILTYQSEPILAFSFQLSPGETRNGTTVFGVPLPYLKSVACPADETNPKVQQTFRISVQTLAKDLGLQGTVSPGRFAVSGRDEIGYVHTVVYGSQSWSGPQFAALLHLPSSNFTLVSSSSRKAGTGSAGPAGKAPQAGQHGQTGPAAQTGSTGLAGKAAQSGTAASPATSHSSTTQNSPSLIIETKGIGLDLGMSLNEATAMADAGKKVNQILSYFYPGTTLTSDSKWASGLKST